MAKRPHEKGADFADYGETYGTAEARAHFDREAARNKKPNGYGDFITPTPFKWIEPSRIPPRQWIYGYHYIRQHASGTFAASKGGKTSLLIVEALAIVTGRPLLNIKPRESCKVWLWNGEDPLDELQRRVTAAMIAYGIKPGEVEGRLFLDSGCAQPLVIAAQTKAGTVIAEPVEQRVTQLIGDLGLGVFAVDPFISCHGVPENDNVAIDTVAKTWTRIAARTNCAIELAHHIRKSNGASEVAAEDARGAGSFIAALRCTRGLSRMNAEEAKLAGIDNHRSYFWIGDTGGNLAPPSDDRQWYQFKNISLKNGDDVGVVARWEWPSAFADNAADDLLRVQKRIMEGEWRKDSQSVIWAGHAVAEVLKLDLTDEFARARVKRMLKIWIENHALKEVKRRDEKRMMRTWIEVDEWATI